MLPIVFMGVYAFNTNFATISGFFGQVWTYMLAGVAAIVLPFKLKDLFEASPVRSRVECSPPYDQSEQTSLIAARVLLDCLAAQVRSGRVGLRAATLGRRPWGPLPPT